MVRTIVTLDEGDKRWLDKYSEGHRQSTAKTIRLAIRDFKKRTQEIGHHQALKQTAGLLNGKDDSVQFVRNIRKEWD